MPDNPTHRHDITCTEFDLELAVIAIQAPALRHVEGASDFVALERGVSILKKWLRRHATPEPQEAAPEEGDPPRKDKAYWAVTGRFIGDDEDGFIAIGPCEREGAIAAFVDAMVEQSLEGATADELRAQASLEPDAPLSAGVIVNLTFRSDSPIS